MLPKQINSASKASASVPQSNALLFRASIPLMREGEAPAGTVQQLSPAAAATATKTCGAVSVVSVERLVPGVGSAATSPSRYSPETFSVTRQKYTNCA